MPSIHVTSLVDAPGVAARIGASHLVSLLRLEQQPPTPPSIAAANHLRVDINDITVAADGLIHPQSDHVAEVIAFARGWDRSRPMLVHCFAGISRSTAAAYISACAVLPGADPLALALALRRASPTASPNMLLIEHADDLLAADGRMIEAIETIGRGELAMAGEPFCLRLSDFGG